MSPNKRLSARLKKSHADFATLANKRVGARIAERRAMAKITLAELGMPMGVTMQQAQRYEAGVTPLDVPGLISIARTLGCRASDLLMDFEGGEVARPPLSKMGVKLGIAFDTIENSVVKEWLVDFLRPLFGRSNDAAD